MKKLLLIPVLALILISCSKSDDDCDCIKETYQFNTDVVFDVNGMPHLQATKEVLSNQSVPCQPEQSQVSNGNDTYFNITCE